MVCVSTHHEIIVKKKTVEKVVFSDGSRLCQDEHKPSGKHKRNTHWMEAHAPLCTVTCTDGESYVFYRFAAQTCAGIHAYMNQ